MNPGSVTQPRPRSRIQNYMAETLEMTEKLDCLVISNIIEILENTRKDDQGFYSIR